MLSNRLRNVNKRFWSKSIWIRWFPNCPRFYFYLTSFQASNLEMMKSLFCSLQLLFISMQAVYFSFIFSHFVHSFSTFCAFLIYSPKSRSDIRSLLLQKSTDCMEMSVITRKIMEKLICKMLISECDVKRFSGSHTNSWNDLTFQRIY